MKIISHRMPFSRLKSEFMHFFPDMIKADIDIDKRVLAVDAELHADLETLLLENGSLQENVWGVNIFPDRPPSDCVEFTSLINIRPSQNNRSMEVEDQEMRRILRDIINELIDFAS